MPVRVRVVDHGAERAKWLAQQPRKHLRIGILPAEAVQLHPSREGVTIGDVAVWMEYGTGMGPGSTPARSWLFDWLAENEKLITEQLATDTYRVIFAGDDEATSLGRRGTAYRQSIQGRIKRRIPPPNAPYTLLYKRGDTPLMDTKLFYDSIRWEVIG
jgi:hypothetical protein